MLTLNLGLDTQLFNSVSLWKLFKVIEAEKMKALFPCLSVHWGKTAERCSDACVKFGIF